MKMVGLQTGVLIARSVSVVAAIAALLVFKYDSTSSSLHSTALSALSTMLCGHCSGYLLLLGIQLFRVLIFGLPALPGQLLPCLGLLLLDGGLAVCMYGISWSGVSFVEHTVRYHDAQATRLKFHAALGLVAGHSASFMAILEFFLVCRSF